MSVVLFIACFLAITWVINYYLAIFWLWSLGVLILLLIFSIFNMMYILPLIICWIIWAIISVLFISPKFRDKLLYRPLWIKLKGKIKPMSKTEAIAIDSGDTWFESGLLKGNPDWKLFDKSNFSELSNDEKSFLSNQTTELIAKLDDWDINSNKGLSGDIWEFIKTNGFMGLVISKEYGGLGFGSYAHSEIVKRIAVKSIAAAIMVMVPNSLGPGELLQKYGTDEQKKKYLKRLACGDEIPCFALTGPLTGSDATNMPDKGVVCYRKQKGENILGLLLTFDKRYITLAPIASLIGLAIDVIDPDNLLPKNHKIGITLCLLPAKTPGVKIGDYHLPLNVKFNNGVISGHKVFIQISQVIGGIDKIGHGWEMLTDCLAEGRALSLPSLSSASSAISFLSSTSYTLVRQQFKRSIIDFPGVGVKVAKISGFAYMIEALRNFTLIPVSNGLKPSVLSAMAKYFSTELARESLNDAMDVHGGKAIIDGPSNYLARLYDAAPISITVEGANLLTRNMIVFGQGVMRSHPHLKDLFESIINENKGEFYKLCNAQTRLFIKNSARVFLKSILNIKKPKNYREQINIMSLRFSILVDVSLMVYGPKIKIKERLSARLSDIWGYLVIACSVIKYENKNKNKNLLLDWSINYCLHKAQEAMYNILENLEYPWVPALSRMIFPWGRVYKKPSDKLDKAIIESLKSGNSFREDIADQLDIKALSYPLLYDLEEAFRKYQLLSPVWEIINSAIKFKKISSNINHKVMLDEALAKNIITPDMAKQWQDFISLTNRIIAVDVFSNKKIK